MPIGCDRSHHPIDANGHRDGVPHTHNGRDTVSVSAIQPDYDRDPGRFRRVAITRRRPLSHPLMASTSGLKMEDPVRHSPLLSRAALMPDTRSAVKHRPANVVPQALVVKYEFANRLREQVTLPLALESASASPSASGAAARAALIA